MNSVIMIGRLTKDPELKYTTTGKAVARFPIAVDRPFAKEKTADFFNVVVWGKPAENVANYMSKGRLVGIKGTLQSRSYEDKAGQKRYVTEIVAENVEFLDRGDKKESSANTNTGSVDEDFEGFQALEDDEEILF